MAANMYARSIFGEDVLANLSIERSTMLGQDAPVQGHIRIRAKSQVSPSLYYIHVRAMTVYKLIVQRKQPFVRTELVVPSGYFIKGQ